MIRKSDLSLRIGMTMLILCAAMALTALPAAANYTADKPLVTYDQGTVTGGMNYTIGNSSYSPKLWNYNSAGTNDSFYVQLTPSVSGTTAKARLYIYWTWAFNNTSSTTPATDDIGIEPNMTVTFDGNVINTTKPDTRYVDWKDDDAAGTNTVTYNYPSGTYAYDVTNYVDASNSSRTYVVNVTNTKPYNGDDASTTGDDKESFNIQAIGLLTLYNDQLGDDKNYWIDEGCDVTNVAKFDATSSITDTGTWSITPDQAVSLANFTNVDTSNAASATLITCAPSAGTQYNRLYVNYFFNYTPWQNIKYWDGLWTGHTLDDGVTVDGNFSCANTEVLDNLIDDKTNYVGFQNGLCSMVPLGKSEGQMQAANAFLLLNYSS